MTYQEVWFILPHDSSFNIQPTYIVASLLSNLRHSHCCCSAPRLRPSGLFSVAIACYLRVPVPAVSLTHTANRCDREGGESGGGKERRWQRGKEVYVTPLQCEPAAKIGSAFFFPPASCLNLDTVCEHYMEAAGRSCSSGTQSRMNASVLQ